VNAAFGKRQQGFIDNRGRWLALVFLGIVALAWPLSALLPVASEAPAGAGLGWNQLLIAAFVPALLRRCCSGNCPRIFCRFCSVII